MVLIDNLGVWREKVQASWTALSAHDGDLDARIYSTHPRVATDWYVADMHAHASYTRADVRLHSQRMHMPRRNSHCVEWVLLMVGMPPKVALLSAFWVKLLIPGMVRRR